MPILLIQSAFAASHCGCETLFGHAIDVVMLAGLVPAICSQNGDHLTGTTVAKTSRTAIDLVRADSLLWIDDSGCTFRHMSLGTHAPTQVTSSGSLTSVGVRQLDHVAIVVSDLVATRRFYVDVLGMTEVDRPDFAFDGAWFQAGQTLVHAIAEHPGSGSAGERFGDFSRISRTQHIAFSVDDALACVDVLASHGVAIVAGPKSRPDGAAQTVIQDPDGYVVELVSETGGEQLAIEGGRE